MSTEQWYRIHRIRKRSGGWREILVPRAGIRWWVRQQGMSRRVAEVVGEMSRRAGVGRVAHGFHLGRSPVTLARSLFRGGAAPGSYLIEYDLVDAFAAVARPMAPYLGQCGDLFPRLPWGGIRGEGRLGWWWDMDYRDDPDVAPPPGWPDQPETWGIPHVTRGGYIEGDEGQSIDLVTGMERDEDGRPVKIWQGAPLAPYCFQRHMIPLDLMLDQVVLWCQAKCRRYRRYADNFFFLVDEHLVDHVTRLVEQRLSELGLGFRRKRVSQLGSARVVILGLSVDPSTGHLRLAKRTRRRLRALEHAERVRGPLRGRNRQVLQGLRALAAGVAAQR